MKTAVNHLISHCGNLKQGESAIILYDDSTSDIAHQFYDEACLITQSTELIVLNNLTQHGEEPPKEVAVAMKSSNLIISLCKFSLAHSQARIDAGKNGARFLSMPLYTADMLNDESVTFNFRSQLPIVQKVTDILTKGNAAKITTKQGTNITLNIKDRIGNCCPGFVDEKISLGSPPDIESNISPLETESQGVVTIDGSITCPEIGLLETKVTLEIKNGRITSFSSENNKYVEILNEMFGDKLSKRRILAEFGIGLNPAAKLTGNMLTDEGAMGYMHFGFGSNYTVGGINKVDFHLDFVFGFATLEVDNKIIFDEGRLLI